MFKVGMQVETLIGNTGVIVDFEYDGSLVLDMDSQRQVVCPDMIVKG